MQKKSPANIFDVILITGRTVSLSREEATRVFLHPWILLTYSALSLMTVAMNQVPWTQGMPVWLRTAIYFLSSVVGLSMAWATLISLSWAVTLRLIRRVHSIIFDLTGAFMSLFTTYCLVSFDEKRPDLVSISSLFLFAFYIVIIVHVSIFLWSIVIPRILVEIRLRDNFKSLTPFNDGIEFDEMSAEATREEVPVLAQNAVDQNDMVFVGSTRIPHHSILHIRAEGNYIRLHTSKASYFEAATMKTALSQIPVHLGFRVHRSHWISYSAIQSIESDGRNLKISLVTGSEVPVSRSNWGKVKQMMPFEKFDRSKVSSEN